VLVLVWLELIRSVRVLMRFQFLIGMRVLVSLVAGMIVRVFVHMAMSVFMAVGMAMRLTSVSMLMGMRMLMRIHMRMLVRMIAVHHLLLTWSFSDRPNIAPVAAEAKKAVGFAL
jgi:hypothetical protein